MDPSYWKQKGHLCSCASSADTLHPTFQRSECTTTWGLLESHWLGAERHDMPRRLSRGLPMHILRPLSPLVRRTALSPDLYSQYKR
jgi:hypothetical protein